MKRFLVRILIYTVLVLFLSYALKGIYVENTFIALVVALLIGVFNTLLRPVLVILTIPITIVTLGLFLFVINAFIILLVDRLVPDFHVDGFWWALLFSLLLSIIGSLLGLSDRKRYI